MIRLDGVTRRCEGGDVKKRLDNGTPQPIAYISLWARQLSTPFCANQDDRLPLDYRYSIHEAGNERDLHRHRKLCRKYCIDVVDGLK